MARAWDGDDDVQANVWKRSAPFFFLILPIPHSSLLTARRTEGEEHESGIGVVFLPGGNSACQAAVLPLNDISRIAEHFEMNGADLNMSARHAFLLSLVRKAVFLREIIVCRIAGRQFFKS